MRWWDQYILRRRVRVEGERNKIYFGDEANTRDLSISIQGNDNKIVIGDRTLIRGLITIRGNNHIVAIGADSRLGGVDIMCREGAGLTIGSRILAATGLTIRTSDGHSIFDLSTGERTNPAAPVVIGDHVWTAREVSIGKGVSIPSDCIVAARSAVTKSFSEEHLLIGGMPARILKTGVTWSTRLKPTLATPDGKRGLGE